MEHTLIYTIIASIVVAFVLGLAAKQLKLPSIFGYLLAGIVVGPYSPGFIADVALARQLAEIGVILLMFGVGLNFSVRDLLDSRKIALPGAMAQIVFATLVGGAVGMTLGHDPAASFLFGFSLSVASTIVLIRSLEQRKLLKSVGGKIAISWLVIEDIVMVFALVMIPVLAKIIHGQQEPSMAYILPIIVGTLFKVGGFAAFMVIGGRRFLPWLIVRIAKVKSAEINTLGSLAIALGFAMLAYTVFDASLALGAFLAGATLSETEIGRKSAESSVQIRDAFSVLFFVSVGMLFDPHTLLEQPFGVLLTFLTIVVAKSLAALTITSWYKLPPEIGHAVAISLAQIGEFSFILGGLALAKGLIAQDLYNLILAGAMLSIVVNPFIFRLYDASIKKA